MLDKMFQRRYTRSQASEMNEVLKRLKNLHMHDDDESQDPKGDIVNYALMTSVELEPPSYERACNHDVWQQAMKEKMNSIKKNDTWELVDLPKGKKCIGCKWVYKTKINADESIERHKARLVAKGFTKKYGIAYEETFAPMVRQETIRLVLSLAAHKGWNINHMDVKSAFLNGFLNEEVFVKQPQGFEE